MIPESQIASTERSARSGDGYDAYRLYVHYFIWVGDRKKARQWYTLAHKLGESGCEASPSVVFLEK